MDYQTEAVECKGFFDRALGVLTKKAHDYASEGDCFSNFTKIASMVNVSVEKVFLVFMAVKVARITELVEKNETKVGESISDSLTDIANYASLFSVYLLEKEGKV